MESLLADITQHGYSVVFILVLAEAVGLPVPAALALFIAGATSAKGSLHLGRVILTSFSALLIGDSLLFVLGRATGWWLLGILCKLSLNPDSCMLRATDLFRRYGRVMLVLAKFVPGLNTLAPPLAGSMNMRFVRFFAFDLMGAFLYASAWSIAGFLFSDFLAAMSHGYQAGGRFLSWLVIIALVIYFAYHAWLILKAERLLFVPRVSASEIARRYYSDLHRDMIVYDVRSHGYYSPRASRIKGSLRLEPNTILQYLDELPRDKELVLYCTCHREATAIRIARLLQQHGFRASVIRGGLRAWRRGGFPLETVPAEDVVLLPTF